MTETLEQRIRNAAPEVSDDPDIYLALLELNAAAQQQQRHAQKKRRGRIGIGVAATSLCLLIGGGVATAATNMLPQWSAPHDVTAEIVQSKDRPTRIGHVKYYLAAEYTGNASSPTSAQKQAFALAQEWLLDYPIVVSVSPSTDGSTEPRVSPWDKSMVQEFQAIRDSQAEIEKAYESRRQMLTENLERYLVSQGCDPSLIRISSIGGLYEVME